MIQIPGFRRSRPVSYCVLIAGGIAIMPSLAAAQSSPKVPVRIQFSEKTIESIPKRFPVTIPNSGSLTLQIQILLDRAGFSPGIIDGGWGINAAKAMTFFTKPDDAERLSGDSPPPVKSIDKATYTRLRSTTGVGKLLRRYTLTERDLAGPYTEIPSSVYQQAKLP
ncbi:MAG TPA: hypothetical protein VFT21_00110, partial [Gemmatimonadaceae bacterium]|nr:hypothetical protein [Gemmatimonadaceae bacterium]